MHRQIMAIAQQAARKLATHIAQPDETDLHVFDILSLRRSPGRLCAAFCDSVPDCKAICDRFQEKMISAAAMYRQGSALVPA
jgi:hypothetical protein